ncbi:ferrous iron transporter B [Novosphingopyxis sp. YJ-S2-01]|uniref:ferrous iron transporter B n=1 Tax=Novosphingopyxis sp. YJ-S2-01 TaxID=2794021 RepID=UPI0018DBA614|nr:ferrous iron transporter B [Novosphingopyxis sp. YJ-S2-01]MBH9536548.1 ferrous iron transporter B [Novosphingopyxis sp. YJ-S2-01]
MTTHQPLIALAGNPNAGKSALFNALTGARQKIANYPGVTVERKSGRLFLSDGRPVEVVDLPGSYSLKPHSLDEKVTRDVVTGQLDGQRRPDAIVVVVDASNLDNHLRFALELIDLGLPVVVALNMVDLAKRDGLELDPQNLSAQLGVPVIETVAVRRRGIAELNDAIENALAGGRSDVPLPADLDNEDRLAIYSVRARKLARSAIKSETATRQWTRMIDSVLLHPLAGMVVLIGLMFLMFQAVFAWSEAPIGWIEGGMDWLAGLAGGALPDGIVRSFVVDGVIAGVGSVIVFLPQILILFLFILVLEATGYMTRAAFVMDRMMASVGLSGHSFIPLLSSFACAIPGIMATRSIRDEKDRLTTILVAPLMTCSARLPVYTIIIASFIPARSVGPGIGLQGLVLLGLYLFGIVGAMIVSLVLRRSVTKGAGSGFLIEMPKYQMPHIRDVAIGLFQRAWIFMRRAGTIIFFATILLWALLSFPKAPADSGISQVDYSVAGRIANTITPAVEPIGFNRDIALALIPAMAAREVAVSALGTVYAIDAENDEGAVVLGDRLAADWTLPTALAFLMWFVFAPQCISTIAVTRRETAGWKWPTFMVVYLFGLAYVMSGLTYWAARAAGL